MAVRKRGVNVIMMLAVFAAASGFLLQGLSGAFEDPGGMHDQRSPAGLLQEAIRFEDDDIRVELKTEPAKIVAGSPATLLFSIVDREGKPVKGLTIMHDRILHVVIAGQDFRTFAHIHPDDFEKVTPEVIKAARFWLRYDFPKAGRYIIGTDFAVNDRPFSRHFVVDVSGEPAMGPPRMDLSREKNFGAYEVTLSSTPGTITAGRETMLRYIVSMNVRPVTDLEPYLSAAMHLSIISSDLKHFIHTHGQLPGMPPMGPEHMHMAIPDKFGPEIDVYTLFPAGGIYQIFGEFRHHGRVIVTSFMVDVK
jgi:hypothetical protein